MVAVVVSTPCYIHFVSYALMLTAFCVISLHRWRLGSCILPWVCNGVCLDVGSISCVVGDVSRSVGGGVGWSISCSIDSGTDRQHHFVFASSLFNYWLKGIVVTMLLTRTFRPTPRVGTCCRSTISRAPFFNLSSGDAYISLEMSYRRSILKLV
jgi:hypothetical protein